MKRKTVIQSAVPLSALLVLVAALAPFAHAGVVVTGVLSTGNHVVNVTSVTLWDEGGGMNDFTTSGWQGDTMVEDTFVFPEIEFPPVDVEMHISGEGMPQYVSYHSVRPDTWYVIGGTPQEAKVMYTGWEPGVEEHEQPGHERACLTVSPSVIGASATIRAGRAAGTNCAFEFYDVAGNRVRTLRTQASSAGVAAATWTGEDDSGRKLPEGVYYCCLADAAKPSVLKLVLAH